MNLKSARRPASAQSPSNGGDYVTEGMAVLQPLVPGALTPVA